MTPAIGAASIGKARIPSTPDTCSGESVLSKTSQPSVTCCTHVPALMNSVPNHSSRKFGKESAENVPDHLPELVGEDASSVGSVRRMRVYLGYHSLDAFPGSIRRIDRGIPSGRVALISPDAGIAAEARWPAR